MEENFYLSEITLQYKNKVQYKNRLKITDSNSAAEIFRDIWEYPIDHRESTYILLINGANQVLGYNLVSIGGKSSTIVDITLILQVAIKVNASAIILAHNHPSGVLTASAQDKNLTKNLNDACKLIGIRLLDHLIISSDGYFSFSDDGLI